MRISKGFLALLVLLSSLHLRAAEALPPVNTVDELDARILQILEEHNAPGMIGAVVYGNEIIWQGALGVANKELNQPVTHNTLFRVASISKSIVSLSILKLVERGELNLDDVISDLIPDVGIQNPWQDTDPIRLVHTLEHTAGFDDIHFRDFAYSDPTTTTQEGIEFNNGSKTARWRPGTRMSYSNIGPPIAALALEKVSGQTFESFAQTEIFDPLGMNTATFFFDDAVASSYSSDNTNVPYVNILVRPSGAMNVTSLDMAQLLKMYNGQGSLDGYQLIQPETLQRMERPETTLAAASGIETGYGLSNMTTIRNGFTFHGHDGGIDGFASYYGYLPEHGRGYFYSVNQMNNAAVRDISELLAAFVTRDLPVPQKASTVEVSNEVLSDFEGFYETDSPRIELLAGSQRIPFFTVTANNSKLAFKPFLGDVIELLPVGENRFRQEDEPVATVAFVTSPDNEFLLQGAASYKRISALKAYGRLFAGGYALILFLSSLGFSIFWLARKLITKSKPIPFLRVRAAASIASFAFLLYFSLVGILLGSNHIAEVTILTLSVWIVSLVLPAAAGAALYSALATYQQRSEVGTMVWHHSLHTALALTVVVVFLFGFGFIGLQTWSY